MSLTAYPTLLEKLRDKPYRRAFASASVRHRIALQIRALRKHKSWSQKELGQAADKPQNVISRLEDPSYGKVTVQTLLDLAATFDVALIVRFATFGDLAESMEALSSKALEVPSFQDELAADYFVQNLADSILPRGRPVADAVHRQSAMDYKSMVTSPLGSVPLAVKPASSTVLSAYQR